jgi:outer membrane protein assembly factor BamE (lipoprotein component of BamABCDE complex)
VILVKKLIALALALFFVISLAACDNDDSEVAEAENISSDSIQADVGGVNAETFALLSDGMSIEEIQELIGVPPYYGSTTVMLGTTTTVVMWMGSDSDSITVMFTDGYATLITQMGLLSEAQSEASTPTTGGVNAETFVLLRNGMGIEEVQEIIGIPPYSESTLEFLGLDGPIVGTVMMWVGEGLSVISVTFTNGYATSITQIGL